MHWVLQRLAEVESEFTVSAVLQTTLVALCALTFVSLGRRFPAKLQYAILLVALAKFAVPPTIGFPTGILGRLLSPAIRDPNVAHDWTVSGAAGSIIANDRRAEMEGKRFSAGSVETSTVRQPAASDTVLLAAAIDWR